MSVVDAQLLAPPRLRFDAAIPSRLHVEAYNGLKLHGPFDTSQVQLAEKSILFVFPRTLQPSAHRLADALKNGHKGYPGFAKMFRIPFTGQMMTSLPIEADLGSPAAAAASYREQIAAWSTNGRDGDPQLALVLVPHSERWETDRPYYEAKAAFARLGIPTQMVTTELIEDERQFGWSVANIGLATFAKLGGVPWTIEAPDDDHDLVLGIGRADIRRHDGIDRIFGYAVSFTSNGLYRQTWSFTPAADEDTYLSRLEDALVNALEDDLDADQPPERLVIHLGKKTRAREIEAVRSAMQSAGVELPALFMRLDDSHLYDIADGRNDARVPPKGLAVRLGPNRMLLQAEGAGPLGPPDGPLLVELDRRSDGEADQLEGLVEQAYRLGHANWRGFNARSQPVTLAYGELLARLVGYLEEVDTWDPALLRSDLQGRPWFL